MITFGLLLILTSASIAQRSLVQEDDPLVEAPLPEKPLLLSESQLATIRVKISNSMLRPARNSQAQPHGSQEASLPDDLEILHSIDTKDTGIEQKSAKKCHSASPSHNTDSALLNSDDIDTEELISASAQISNCMEYEQPNKCRRCRFSFHCEQNGLLCVPVSGGNFQFAVSGLYLSYQNTVPAMPIGLKIPPPAEFRSLIFHPQNVKKNRFQIVSVSFTQVLSITAAGKPIWESLLLKAEDSATIFEITGYSDSQYSVRHLATGLYLADYDRTSTEPEIVTVTYFQSASLK